MYNSLIILFSIFCILSSPVNAETIVTRRPIFQPYYDNSYDALFSDINELEEYTFGRNYKADNGLSRLQRLEQQAFGAIQNGDPAIRYDNARNAILSRPKVSTRNSIIRGLKKYLDGQLTGYTPSIINTYPYYSNYDSAKSYYYPQSRYSNPNYMMPSGFGNTSYMNYGANPFFNGYRVNNYGTGSSGGIKVLP